MTEQRQVRRHPESVIQASFERSVGGTITVSVWDASLGGMFLETDDPLEEGALVSLEIRTADSTVSVDTRVLWARPTKLADDQPAGMAVRFIDLPDDVSVALTRALQSGMQEKTILGVGGASIDTTQIGIPAPAVAVTPRETQIGVAPPANTPRIAKPHLVLSDTSLPSTPAAPAAKPADPTRLEETSPSRARLSSIGEPERTREKSVFGRLLLFMIVGGAAAGAYQYRDKIAEQLAPPPPPAASTSPPRASEPPPPQPSESASPAVATPPDDAAARVAHVQDAGTQMDAGTHDAGAHDAGARDAGVHDAGARDAGAHKSRDGGAKKSPPHDPTRTD